MTRSLRATVAACALVLAVSTAVQGQAPRGGDANVRAAIEAANKKYFIDAAPKGDAALLAQVYSDDAIAYPANADPIRGRAAIQAMWQSVFASGVNAFVLTTSEVESAGDIAWEAGTYEMKMKDGNIADRGNYVVVWKRVQGQWKLHRDIWTTSMPAAKK